MKNKFFLSTLLLTLFFLSLTIIYFFYNGEKDIHENINNINVAEENYNDYVEITNTTSLFTVSEKKYTKKGVVSKGVKLKLDGSLNNYYKIKDMPYYVYYKDVVKNNEKYNERYKKYNQIGLYVTTKDKCKLFQDDDKYMIINNVDKLNILYTNKDKYYTVVNENLYYILKQDVQSENRFNTEYSVDSIPVLNYHFFYDEDIEFCGEILCLEKKKFDEHLKYFKENNYFTLTMEEYYLWINNELNVPSKSILITVDDGALGTDTILIELLEKYDLNATLFLITDWWKEKNFSSLNLEVYSHGNNIHIDNYCNKGPKGVCISYDELKDDIEKSLLRSKSNLAFCYPFYRYNDIMLKVLNDLNFSLAFIGGNKKSKKVDNRLLLPRYIIYRYHTINDIEKMIN